MIISCRLPNGFKGNEDGDASGVNVIVKHRIGEGHGLVALSGGKDLADDRFMVLDDSLVMCLHGDIRADDLRIMRDGMQDMSRGVDTGDGADPPLVKVVHVLHEFFPLAVQSDNGILFGQIGEDGPVMGEIPVNPLGRLPGQKQLLGVQGVDRILTDHPVWGIKDGRSGYKQQEVEGEMSQLYWGYSVLYGVCCVHDEKSLYTLPMLVRGKA